MVTIKKGEFVMKRKLKLIIAIALVFCFAIGFTSCESLLDALFGTGGGSSSSSSSGSGGGGGGGGGGTQHTATFVNNSRVPVTVTLAFTGTQFTIQPNATERRSANAVNVFTGATYVPTSVRIRQDGYLRWVFSD